jgi:chemotaxis signal transduction protein
MAVLTHRQAQQSCLIVQLRNQLYGLPAQQVRELARMPEVSQVTDLPEYVRGVMNLRGRVIPVVDLRKRIGMTSALTEMDDFCAMMEQRQKDHVNWLEELDACVREKREFKLTTDPHRCAFGRWYDSYKPDNPWVAGILRQFEQPHGKIHALAEAVLALEKEGRTADALNLIATHHSGTLSVTVKLFDSMKTVARERQREIVVVLTNAKQEFAVSVDAAVSVEKLADSEIENLPLSGPEALVSTVWKDEAEKRMVLIVDTNRLMGN